jgi:hypothetical protein
VSVVIPTHNYACYVAEAIQSALVQRYRPIEIIVVDDGSTDETPSVLKGFDGSIRVLRLDGRGVSAARNAGLAQAGGEYVVFLDADDVLLPGGVAAQAGLLTRRPDVDAVAGEWYACEVESGRVRRGRSSPKDGEVLSRLLRANIVATPSAMMLRRRVLDVIGGFDTSLSFTADWEMWIRLAKHGCRFASVTAPVATYRIHGRSMTQNLDLAIADTTALLDRCFNDPVLSEPMRSVEPQARFDVMTYLADLCLRQGDDQRAGGCLREALRWAPDALERLALYRFLVDAMSRDGRLERRDVVRVTSALLALTSDLEGGGDEGRRRRLALRHLTAGMIARRAGDWSRGLRHLRTATGASWRTVLMVPQLGWSVRLLLPRWLTRGTVLAAVGLGPADEPRVPPAVQAVLTADPALRSPQRGEPGSRRRPHGGGHTPDARPQPPEPRPAVALQDPT